MNSQPEKGGDAPMNVQDDTIARLTSPGEASNPPAGEKEAAVSELVVTDLHRAALKECDDVPLQFATFLTRDERRAEILAKHFPEPKEATVKESLTTQKDDESDAALRCAWEIRNRMDGLSTDGRHLGNRISAGFMADIIRKHLPQKEAGEVVAWMITSKVDPTYIVTVEPSISEREWYSKHDHQITPLYAAPPDVDVRKVADRIADVVRNLDGTKDMRPHIERELRLSRAVVMVEPPDVVELRAEVERLREEKQRRIYYQSIVYDVCNRLDAHIGVPHGHGIVCGTVNAPTKQVQETLDRALSGNKSLREELQKVNDILANGDLVWINMLSGKIARPSALDHYEQCKTEVDTLRDEVERINKIPKWEPEKDPEMVFAEDYGWLHRDTLASFNSDIKEVRDEVERLRKALERLTKLYEAEFDTEGIRNMRPDWLKEALKPRESN